MTYTVTELREKTISWGPASGLVDGYRVYLDGVLRATVRTGLEVAASVLGINAPKPDYVVSVVAYNTTGEGPAAEKVVDVVNHPLPGAPGPVVIS